MEFARAKGYSDHLQDNVMRGLIGQEAKGKATKPLPPAYDALEKDYEDHPDHLKIIASELHEAWRNAYRMRMEGKTLEEIAALMIVSGYVHKRRYGKTMHTVKVDKDYVRRHLRNPLHCGLLVTGEDSKEPRKVNLTELYPKQFGEEFPVVVTLEDFKKVNPDLFSDTSKKSPLPRKRTAYPLAGKVLCAVRLEQGLMATLTRSAPKDGSGNLSPRFSCQRCKPQHGINMESIFAAVGRQLTSIHLTDRQHQQLVITEWEEHLRVRSEEDITRKQLAALKAANQKQVEEAEETLNIMKYGSKHAASSEVAAQERKLKRLHEERAALTKQEENLNEDSIERYYDLDAFLELAKNAAHYWKIASPEKKRLMADLLLSNVIVNTDGTALVSLAEPFASWSKAVKTDDGRDDRTRTCDLTVPNRALYQLSYIPLLVSLLT
jgi:hypothetical protein